LPWNAIIAANQHPTQSFVAVHALLLFSTAKHRVERSSRDTASIAEYKSLVVELPVILVIPPLWIGQM
jgi:hypothetical protein